MRPFLYLASSRLAAIFLLSALLLPGAVTATASGPMGLLRTAADGLAEPQAKATNDALDAAAAADRETALLADRLAALRSEAANAPARSRELTAQLAVDLQQSTQEWQTRLPARAEVETLETALEQERLVAEQLRSQIATLTTEMAKSLAQPSRTGQELAAIQQRLDELAQPLLPAEGEPEPLTRARSLRNDAERRKLTADLALRQAQQDLAATRQRLQELEMRALRHRLALREPRLALLQERIAELGREELEALAARLAEQAQSVAGEDAAVSEAAAYNRALGDEMLLTNEALARQRAALVGEEEALARDVAGLQDAKTRLELGGQSEQVGTWLWAELRRLEPEARLSERRDEVRGLLGALRLRLITLGELQRALSDIPATVRALRRDAPGSDEDAPAADTSDVDPLPALIAQRRDLASRLEPLIWRHIAALEQSERSLNARLVANRELRATLDRHLLWIRSHSPVDSAWLATLPAGGRDLVKPSRFASTFALVHSDFRERPLRYLGSLLLVLGLFVLHRRAPSRLELLALAVRQVRKDRYRRTFESLAWTIAGALPWAAALFLVGGLLQGVGEAGKYSDSLGLACQALALPLFSLFFLKWMVRERGLAHAHFRWTKTRRDALAAWLPWTIAVLLPLYFVVALSFIRNQELAISVPGRIAIVFASLYSAWVLWDLLQPARIWHVRGHDPEPSATRRTLRVVMPAALVVIALLAIDGYVYSSAIVLAALFGSIGMAIMVAVLHGLLSRWFLLGERRLALHRQDQKRAAAAQVEAEGGVDAGAGGEAVPADVEQEIPLETVNAQSRRLLRAFRLTLMVVGLVWVWADVLPAFARFDEIALWHVNDTAEDGGTVKVAVTLVAVLLGLLALALTAVAARNLPGLLEIGMRSRPNIDAASRYAITSVSRYVIVVVGVVTGLGLLGLHWGQLQWMAAALTVGLGFGLQEIFANFVSGLILLFERPFRVGDVITVNNLDGTVTRIRTRATTILDFDNKEIVVPNKTFITGQLVNWTLSDETTRITMKVGVDYGTDPVLVHRLLLQAANESPRVLQDWPPRSWLLEFGASTLDFELRVFVGAMTDRLAVRNEINMRLIELFHENDIAFAYPQMDIHVRDLPEPRAPVPGTGRSPGGGPLDPRGAPDA
ncbi:mechanosensitive ion channel domain-containing protein [Arenimonas alkanexedens]